MLAEKWCARIICKNLTNPKPFLILTRHSNFFFRGSLCSHGVGTHLSSLVDLSSFAVDSPQKIIDTWLGDDKICNQARVLHKCKPPILLLCGECALHGHVAKEPNRIWVNTVLRHWYWCISNSHMFKWKLICSRGSVKKPISNDWFWMSLGKNVDLWTFKRKCLIPNFQFGP